MMGFSIGGKETVVSTFLREGLALFSEEQKQKLRREASKIVERWNKSLYLC